MKEWAYKTDLSGTHAYKETKAALLWYIMSSET